MKAFCDLLLRAPLTKLRLSSRGTQKVQALSQEFFPVVMSFAAKPLITLFSVSRLGLSQTLSSLTAPSLRLGNML